MKYKLAAVALCLSILLLGTLGGRREAPPAAAVAGVRWVDCWFERELNARLGREWQLTTRCGHLTTSGQTGAFTLAFVVVEDNSPDRRPDPLVHLAGGPGAGSQVTAEQMENWVYWLERANLSRDFILFDQRGTGLSRPKWGCRDYDRFSRRVLADDVALDEEFRQSLEVMRGCWTQLAGQGYKPDYFSTSASAEDVLLLMRQLGYRHWNLFGVSYGTRLALQIASEQPQGLRSAVLDSVYPLDKGLASEWPWLLAHALERLWRRCETGGDGCDGAVSLKTIFWRQMQRLKTQPLTFTLKSWYGEAPYKVVVNDHRLLSIVFSALYDPFTIEKLPPALRELEKGNAALLKDLTEAFVNYALEPEFNSITYFSVECADNPPVTEADYRAAVRAFPDLAAYTESAWRYDICRDLRAGGGKVLQANRPAPGPGGGASYPMLLLSGALDPVTPPEWARELAGKLPGSQHLLFGQIGHAVVSSSDCAHSLLRTYLDFPEQKLDAGCRDSTD